MFDSLLGNGILARLVAEPGVTNVNVYLPGGADELWYDIYDYKVYQGKGNLNVPVTMDRVSLHKLHNIIEQNFISFCRFPSIIVEEI